MATVAVLGSYPDGMEAQSDAEFVGKWSPWKRNGNAPRKIWTQAEPTLRQVIARDGFVNLLVYYGGNLPVEYVLRVDDLVVSEKSIGPPGPTFPAMESETAPVWIRYAGRVKLRHKIRHPDLREVPLTASGFGAPPIQIREQTWLQMFQTGLFFIADPIKTTP